MTQKRFRKLCMAKGLSRNEANLYIHVVKELMTCEYTDCGVKYNWKRKGGGRHESER